MLLGAVRTKARANGSSQSSSSGKKQRSIHDFFSQSTARKGGKLRKARRSLEASAKGNSFSSAMEDGEDETVAVQKRIDYDVMDDESSEEPMLLASQSSDGGRRPRPKKIDFTGCSSQRSEPDFEPLHTPVRFGLPPTSQGYYTPGMGTPLQQYSQDEMDFLTPRDQPVIPLSNPTTPSPLKKRPRLNSGADVIQEEQVQNLTQDMTHMDVRHARKGLPSFSSQSSMDMGSPQKVNVVVNAKRQRPNGDTSFLSEESYVNPFAPEPMTESGKKKISRRKRRSFPSAWVGAKNGSPVSKYLSDFSELGLIGSGSFSKVYKCMKKIDGWVYAVKKSKRHFRGKADTAIFEGKQTLQALAALSSSNHVVRYFDAWIEDDLLYIQLENLEGCSLAGFVNKYAPQKVPEETLCKLLCHIAQALYDMHSKKMVHMDVKLQNVLVGSGEIYKLGDLGTVAHLDGSMEITEGDNRYLSRELLEGNRNNLRAGDIFALGATIYELALGTTLASGGEEWQKIRDGDLVMFRQYSNSLQHLIASMLHPDALQRPLAEDILQHEVVLPFR
ncbi:WEE protein kinase [Phytophthora megakarya]|uniref:WEE protein kinase n=1 Tax=Phytophthora megakarya TaxID=4795 RepID=A0A225VS97_9STRA|nr:WEE protein kinase [Phytophthora megakarya]